MSYVEIFQRQSCQRLDSAQCLATTAPGHSDVSPDVSSTTQQRQTAELTTKAKKTKKIQPRGHVGPGDFGHCGLFPVLHWCTGLVII